MSDGRLQGWKAIGDYLQVSDRTARRWAEQAALPVHRVPLAGRPLVFAIQTEIDAWLTSGRARESPGPTGEDENGPEARPGRPRPARPGRWIRAFVFVLLALGGIAGAGLGLAYWSHPPDYPVLLPSGTASPRSDSAFSPQASGLSGPRASAVPRSASHVILRLAPSADEQFSVDVADGGLATVSYGSQSKLGLTPVLRGDQVELDLLRLFRRQPNAAESAAQVGTTRLTLATPLRVQSDSMALTVTWLNIRAAGDVAMEELSTESCCVSCGSATVCALGVASGCGRCGSLAKRVVPPRPSR